MVKALSCKSFFGLFVFIAILSCSPKIPGYEPVHGKTEMPADMTKSILDYVNEYRHSKGLSSLQPLDIASKQAYLHSKEMANRETGFGHEGFDQRMQNIKQNFGWITASAENVAYGQLSAKEVVEGWLNSPGHKKNMEGNYTFTGIGVYKDRKGVIFFTQIFIRK